MKPRSSSSTRRHGFSLEKGDKFCEYGVREVLWTAWTMKNREEDFMVVQNLERLIFGVLDFSVKLKQRPLKEGIA